MLQRLIGHLAALGVDEIAIVLGYLGAQIRDAIAAWQPSSPRSRVDFVENREYATTNNGYSTLLARDAVGGSEFLLLDADIVCEREVISSVLRYPKSDCLAVRPSNTLGTEEMKILLDGQGRVRECAKTVDPRAAFGESLGINRFSHEATPRFFAALDERVRGRGLVNEWNDSAVQQMIDEQGYELWPVDVGGWYCAEIDTPTDLAEVDAKVRSLEATQSSTC
jgi:choline kinase